MAGQNIRVLLIFSLLCLCYVYNTKNIMTWKIRQRGEDLYHHIYAWGNDRHPVFKKPAHYQKYLLLVGKYSKAFQIDIIAYALMEWHVHLFIHDRRNRISEFIMDLHGDYAKYYNRVTNRVGHVFGERFNNKVVQCDLYGKWLSRYIHCQALDAGLVPVPEDYLWSSYRTYLGLEKNAFVKGDIILDQFGKGDERAIRYKDFVDEGEDGPVDWNLRYFCLRSVSDLVKVACVELNIEPECVIRPQGRQEQRIRSKVVQRLVTKYGVKAVNIAKTLGLSRSAVARMLQREI